MAYDKTGNLWEGKWQVWGDDATGQRGFVGLSTDEAYLPVGNMSTGTWALSTDNHKIYFWNNEKKQWTQKGRVVVLASY